MSFSSSIYIGDSLDVISWPNPKRPFEFLPHVITFELESKAKHIVEFMDIDLNFILLNIYEGVFDKYSLLISF